MSNHDLLLCQRRLTTWLLLLYVGLLCSAVLLGLGDAKRVFPSWAAVSILSVELCVFSVCAARVIALDRQIGRQERSNTSRPTSQ